MSLSLITEKYKNDMHGVINCFDRIIINGNLQSLCYPKGMTAYLYAHNIRIFDYAETFANPLREAIRENAESIAKKNQIEIEFIGKVKQFRKEDRIQKIIQARGNHPGLVHIFSAMEQCTAYKPWHNKETGKTYLNTTGGKCLHYYFYFIDDDYGLCYLRVPTWAPFRLQFYFNGHNLLAAQLKQHGIKFELVDNAFSYIADFDKANQLASQPNIQQLHDKLNSFVQQYCPAANTLNMEYNWTIMQAEYATDLIFKNRQPLQTFYPSLIETMIQTVKPDNIATFLGRKITSTFSMEAGNSFNARWLGTRLKHTMGAVSIKMYDKFNLILRIETTVSDVSFFKQYRSVQLRDGTETTKWANMKKTIYSLPALQESLLAANQRYLKFISEMQIKEIDQRKLSQLAETREENQHRYKGFNLLSEEDISLFQLMFRGEFSISGFTNKNLRQFLSSKQSSQITRLINRLLAHELIKKVNKRYKYYLTEFGRHVMLTVLKIREMVVIPQLGFVAAC